MTRDDNELLPGPTILSTVESVDPAELAAFRAKPDPRFTDPLTAEDVPPLRRRPTDEEVAARLLVLVKESRKTLDAYHAADGYGRPLRPDPTKADEYPPGGVIVWLLWAVSLLLAALAGALVRGML